MKRYGLDIIKSVAAILSFHYPALSNDENVEWIQLQPGIQCRLGCLKSPVYSIAVPNFLYSNL